VRSLALVLAIALLVVFAVGAGSITGYGLSPLDIS